MIGMRAYNTVYSVTYTNNGNERVDDMTKDRLVKLMNTNKDSILDIRMKAYLDDEYDQLITYEVNNNYR